MIWTTILAQHYEARGLPPGHMVVVEEAETQEGNRVYEWRVMLDTVDSCEKHLQWSGGAETMELGRVAAERAYQQSLLAWKAMEMG